MDSRKKKVLTVLCIGALILGWRVFVVVSEYLPTQAQAGGQQMAVIDAAFEKDETATDDLRGLLDAQRQVAEKDWGRNPFADVPWAARPATDGANIEKPGTQTSPPTPAFVLKGVSRSGPLWLAAVDGKIVRVGDEMEGGYTIAEITAQSITLESQGWAFTFVIGSEEADIRRLSGTQ